MSNFLKFRMECLQDQITSSRKAGRGLWGIFFLNTALIFPNAYFLYKGTGNWFTGVGLGAVAMNALWMLIAIMDYMSNVSMDKLQLTYLKNRRVDDDIEQMQAKYEKAIKMYEEAFISISAKERDSSMAEKTAPESTVFSGNDTGIQPAQHPNCCS